MEYLNISGQMLELRSGDAAQLVPVDAVFTPIPGAFIDPSWAQPVMHDDPPVDEPEDDQDEP